MYVSTWVGGAEIAITGKCKIGKVNNEVAKCVRVENTSTENSSTAMQGWKTQVWKSKVRVSRVGKCKYGKSRVWNNSTITGNTTKITIQHGWCAEAGVGKIGNFQPISGRISETVQDRTNRKSYMRFRLVPKSMTLNDLSSSWWRTPSRALPYWWPCLLYTSPSPRD